MAASPLKELNVQAPEIPTPLESSGSTCLPKNKEIVTFLRRLGGRSSVISVVDMGRSAGGRRIVGVSTVGTAKAAVPIGRRTSRLRIMIVGSQHGRETSGAEALQMLVRDLAEERLSALLRRIELFIIPCANPDGRDLERQTNGNRVNLNSDYMLLSQPESRAIAGAIDTFRPHLLLDVHESACFKRRTLGREGYLTDFEAQLDPACHPAIDSGLRQLGLRVILPKLLAAVAGRGLEAQRYVGEISSVRAVISHGSLSAAKLRNYAGLQGILAVLLENRLDRSDVTFPSPRNIAVRSVKQHLSIMTFLETCAEESEKIARAACEAQDRLAARDAAVRLPVAYGYAADPQDPTIRLPYRTIRTGRRVMRTQRYRGRVAVSKRLTMPRALAVTGHRKRVSKLLDRHGIRYAVLNSVVPICGTELVLGEDCRAMPTEAAVQSFRSAITGRRVTTQLSPGDLWVDLSQRKGRIAALILDPRSSDSIFGTPRYFETLKKSGRCFVVPVLDEL